MNALRQLTTERLYRHSNFLALLAIVALSATAYANSLSNGFHFDDIHGIVRNPVLRDLKNIPSYFTDVRTSSLAAGKDWRPVVLSTYALNYAMDGLNPVAFRVTNLLFHVGTAWLIFLIIAEILSTRRHQLSAALSIPPSLLAMMPAALFAVHTANSEAVNYVWARSSVLAAFLYLLGFYCFLRGPLNGQNKTSPLWHLAGLGAFIVGVGAKATVVTLPAILVLYEMLFLDPRQSPLKLFWKEPGRLKKYLPIAAACLAYILFRFIFLRGFFRRVVSSGEMTGVTATTYLLTQFRAWVYYLRLFLWPHPLTADFSGFGWSHSLWDLRVLLSLGLILTILVLAWRARKTQPLVSFFILWFFIALLPEASFLPLADAVVGYRPYLAYVGLAAIGATISLNGPIWLRRRFRGWEESGAPRLLVYSLAAVVLLALTGATIVRNRDWRDELTLWSDVMQKDPANPRAYMMLGAQFLEQENYENAKEMFEQAIRLRPGRSHAYVLRGYLNSRLHRDAEALADFDTAVRLDARAPYAYFYRGELYRKMGEYEKALADYHAALRFQPFYTDAYLGIAMAHLEKQETAKAVEACTKLVELDPEDRRGYDCLGNLFMEQERLSEAVALYQQGTRRIPRDSGLWYGLGLAHEKNGNYEQAGKAFERAGRLSSELSEKPPIAAPLID